MVHIFASIEEIEAAEGRELGPTAWRLIAQERVGLFADATDDHQWIHIDPERAATGPFGTTIAHGFLTLSLIPAFMHELVGYSFDPVRVNYGLDKVRFLAPVPVGSRVRDRAVIAGAERASGGLRFVVDHTVELESSDRPACVARTITLLR